jgi:hypothetical protein
MVLNGHVERVYKDDDKEEKIICRLQDHFRANQRDKGKEKCQEEEGKQIFETELNAFAHAETL